MSDLKAKILESLDNAVENGFNDLYQWDYEKIAEDLKMYDRDLEEYEIDQLLPFIKEWKKNRIAMKIDFETLQNHSSKLKEIDSDTGGKLLRSEIKRVFGKSGMWGGALIIYEFEVLLPNRGHSVFCSVVICPNEDEDDLVNVVIAHHEGTYSETYEEFMKPCGVDISDENYWKMWKEMEEYLNEGFKKLYPVSRHTREENDKISRLYEFTGVNQRYHLNKIVEYIVNNHKRLYIPEVIKVKEEK